MAVKELSKRNVREDDLNLSRIHLCFQGREILMQCSSTADKREPGSMTCVYELSRHEKSPLIFDQGEHTYELSWAEPDAHGFVEVLLSQHQTWSPL